MKKYLIVFLIGANLFVYGLLFFGVPLVSSRADQANVIDTGMVTEESRVVVHDGSSDIGIYAFGTRSFYQTHDSGQTGVMEFLNEQPQVEGENLLPKNFQKSIRMFRQNTTGNENHYFYQQTVNGIPVYASQFALHQRDGNEIYSVQGNIVTDTKIWTGVITEDQARLIATAEAKKATEVPITVTATQQIIFNGQAIGVSDDPKNYLTYAVYVEATNRQDGFGRKYFVSTIDGTILFSEDLKREAMNRKVSDCNQSTTCSKGRFEGDPVAAVIDVNTTYDTLGKYYNFLKDSFSRDSYDGNGAALVANINFYTAGICPNNAFSDGTSIYFCRGMAVADIISHEMTHSLNHAGPAFVYANQSGAIDEAISDIYASAIDGNWTLGEASPIGTARSLADPPRYGQPDRLFSTNYACASGAGSDDGGVHTNGGILGKAFYLMVNGGTFNTCTITGVGKDKAYAVLYKAEMSYMSSSSNYKTVYNAITQACSDLYGASSSDCTQIRNSLKAVEMDQQTDGAQKSPVCTGGHASAPDCSAAPASSSSSTAASSSSSAAASSAASSVSSNASSASSASSSSVSSSSSSSVPGTGPVTLNVKLRLQGVFSKPANASAIPVKIRLVKNGQAVSSKTVSFAWQDSGIIQASFSLDGASPGEGYALYTKGPLHLERKICDTAPIEISEGRYNCSGNTLTLKNGENAIDATGILQLAGDIPSDQGVQDNLVNSADLSLLRSSIGTKDGNLIKRVDLNYDGIVDGHDFDLANISSQVTLDK